MIESKVYHLLEGAKKARGTAVIIDVFRAFSLECYLYGMGARLIRPVGSVEEAWALHEKIPGSVLIGERHGIRCDGFDFGNSPYQVSLKEESIRDRIVIHTTSAGTQGIVNASGADEILTGSFLNARAIAEYISSSYSAGPRPISLVAMGLSARENTDEDELCAEYIQALLRGEELPDLEEKLDALRYTSGARFFKPELAEHFPKEDYDMCIRHDIFPFVLRIGKDELGYFSERIDVIK